MEYAAGRCEQWPVVARRWERELHSCTAVGERLLHPAERQRSHADKNADRERRPCCQYGRFPVGFYSPAPPPLGGRLPTSVLCQLACSSHLTQIDLDLRNREEHGARIEIRLCLFVGSPGLFDVEIIFHYLRRIGLAIASQVEEAL